MGGAEDAVHGGAEFVAHGGQKVGFCLVCSFGELLGFAAGGDVGGVEEEDGFGGDGVVSAAGFECVPALAVVDGLDEDFAAEDVSGFGDAGEDGLALCVVNEAGDEWGCISKSSHCDGVLDDEAAGEVEDSDDSGAVAEGFDVAEEVGVDFGAVLDVGFGEHGEVVINHDAGELCADGGCDAAGIKGPVFFDDFALPEAVDVGVEAALGGLRHVGEVAGEEGGAVGSVPEVDGLAVGPPD